MTSHSDGASPVVYARVAGLTYIVIIVIAVLKVNLIDSSLIMPGDYAATATRILAHDLLFRIGVTADLIMYAGVVVLAVALYEVLMSVDRHLALLAMLLRTGEAILGMVTVLVGFTVPFLLNGEGHRAAFAPEQVQALAGLLLDVRAASLDLVLIFVGLGGTLFCWLFFKSKYVPRLLAGWGIFTYLSMLVLALVSLLYPEHPAMIENVLYGLGALFELSFGLWLLIRGVDVRSWNPPARAPAGVPPLSQG